MSRSLADLARVNDPLHMRLAGAIRRMAIGVTSRALWQLVGIKNADGTSETIEAELFGGIGIFARPPAGAKPEAIAVMIGGGNTPAIVGVRDEKTRAAVVGSLKEGETAIYNALALIVIKADGTIEIRSKDGTAQPLITKAQFDAHTHVAPPGGGTTAVPSNVGTSGTSVIRGE